MCMNGLSFPSFLVGIIRLVTRIFGGWLHMSRAILASFTLTVMPISASTTWTSVCIGLLVPRDQYSQCSPHQSGTNWHRRLDTTTQLVFHRTRTPNDDHDDGRC